MNTKFKIFIIKFIIVLILFFSIIMNDNLKNNILNNNISFIKLKNTYSKYFGNILPFDKYIAVAPVFNEKLEYISKEDFKEGVKLKVLSNYLVPSINSGIVVFIGEKEDYGNTIIVEGEETIWYSNINSNIKLYDEVKKGEYLGEVKGEELYLIFKKEGKIIDYKKYL